MSSDTEQVEILKLIWNEMKALNTRVDGLRGEMSETRAELKDSQVEARAATQSPQRRMTESEVRLATATTQLSADVNDLSGLIRRPE